MKSVQLFELLYLYCVVVVALPTLVLKMSFCWLATPSSPDLNYMVLTGLSMPAIHDAMSFEDSLEAKGRVEIFLKDNCPVGKSEQM